VGHRMSSLPIAQYCAQGPVLGQLGASRAAAVSTCFHARCAGDERWRELYARLDEKEQGELDAMQAPTPLRLPWCEPLDYAHALKEQPLGLDADLCFVPHSDPSSITSGTADAYWVVGERVVVMDVKRSKWTSVSGSLQLHAYATAVCSLLASRGISVDAYQTAIWAATEGEWDVGPLLALDSPEVESIRARIVSAARHQGTDYSRGRHCRDCYGRSMCPAYLMDPAGVPDALATYFSGELDNDHALKLLELTERAEETAKKARDLLKAHVTKHGQIVDGESVYRPVKTKGRVSLDAKRLEQDHPELVREYMRVGADYDQVRWTGKKRS
jgi:hypothetical protein